jgi:hypothetical protein
MDTAIGAINSYFGLAPDSGGIGVCLPLGSVGCHL